MFDFQQKNISNKSSFKIINTGLQDSIQTSQLVSQPPQTPTLLQTHGDSSQLNSTLDSKPCHDYYFDQTDSYKILSQQSWLTNQYNIDSSSHSGDFELFGEQDKKMDFQIDEYMRPDNQSSPLPSLASSSPLTPLDSTNLCDVKNTISSSEMYSFGINNTTDSIVNTDNMDQFSFMDEISDDSYTNSLTDNFMVSLSSSVLDPSSTQKPISSNNQNNQVYLDQQFHPQQYQSQRQQLPPINSIIPPINLPPINLPSINPINNLVNNNSTNLGSSTSSLISFRCFLPNIGNSYNTNNNILGSASQNFNFNFMNGGQHYPRQIISSIQLPGTINVINVNTLPNSRIISIQTHLGVQANRPIEKISLFKRQRQRRPSSSSYPQPMQTSSLHSLSHQRPHSGLINRLSIEVLQEILLNVVKPSDLFLCLLVNRQWCKIVTPILWQAPNPGFKKFKLLVRTYLLCLSQDMKKFLKANNIPVPHAPRRCLPAFDYPYFLRKITDKFISRLTEAWLFKKWSVEKGKATLHLNRILHDLFFSRAQRINSLAFDDDATWPFIDHQPLSCLQNLSFLKISISNNSDHSPIPFLNSLLISSCSRIKFIEIDIDSKFHDFNDSIVQLIKSQRELEKIALNRCHQILKPLIHILKSNQSNSLKSLRFNKVDFDSFKEVFSDDFVKSLKSIELINCCRLDNKYFKNFICKTQNLSQFEFCDYNSIDPYILGIIINLLTLNNNLKCLVLRISGEYSELVGTIIKHCSKLEYLELPQIRKFDVSSILSSCIHLKYFSFIIDFSLDSSFFLQIAGQLPSNLRNLIITEREKRPAFDLFTYKLFFNSMNSKNLKTLYTSGALLDNLYSRDYQKVFIEHNIKWSYEDIPRLY
ncbi:5166_t:CDS:2 [Dentiscutata erythropus]|uniref:5166_t:CDS:1 n=1 Tax=Dentiscutata erythropus TaxID=1348616 RepID=A0A9N9E0F4_9GLOM|nr:5166_t:CDS:2 [Dentiscutata erythropus]